MLPDIWGKHLWFSIHFIAQDYPKIPTQHEALIYKDFFENLWKVIPCYKCGVNYKRHLQELPLDEHLGSREDLFAWTVELHNIVNRELGKPTMTLDEAKRKYSDPDFNKNIIQGQIIKTQIEVPIESKKNDKIVVQIMFIIIIVLVIIIFFLLYKKYINNK